MPNAAKPNLKLYPNHRPVVTAAMREAALTKARRAQAGFESAGSTEIWLAKRPRPNGGGSFKQNVRKARRAA